jgi:hypothetical protein
VTVDDGFAFLVGRPLLVACLCAALPLATGLGSGALKGVGAARASQQVANGGIALALAALLLEVLGLAYAVRVRDVDPLATTPLVLLAAPPWLVAAAFAVEHIVHPGPQEEIRRPLRTVAMALVTVAVLAAVFSVLRIHMLIFGGIPGFLVFVAALIGVLWFLIRRLL